MKVLKLFDLNVEGIVFRFYSMMAAVIILTLFGQLMLAALIGNILAISFILGIGLAEKPQEISFERRRKSNLGHVGRSGHQPA